MIRLNLCFETHEPNPIHSFGVFKLKTQKNKDMKKISTLTLFISIICMHTDAQAITSNDMELMQGTWVGKLFYTDYGDDQSQVSLESKLTASVSDGSVKLNFDYVEPNGKIVSSNDKMKFIDSKYFSYQGKREIVEQSKADNSWMIVTEGNGKDNNKSSKIRFEIKVSETELSIRKLVKYEGTTEFFQRNLHTFTKE